MNEQDAAPGQCYKCGFQTKPGFLQAHMNKCRGSELLNRTCQKCGREYASYDSVRRMNAFVGYKITHAIPQPTAGGS